MENVIIVHEICATPHIYMIINIDSGKKYIGQSCGRSGYFCGGVYIKRAVKHHGRNKFARIILESWADVPEDLDNIETGYIALYETLAPTGYNLCPVGTGLRQYGEEPWNKGKKATPEAIENQRQAQLDSDYVATDAHKAKMRASALGKKKAPEAVAKRRVTRSKPIQQICIETGEIIAEFDGPSFAAEKLGYPHRGRELRKVCSGKRKTAYGYSWAYK